MTKNELTESLKALPQMRVQVQNLDNALSLLTPEEHMVAALLLLHPKRGNIQQVCQQLNVEQATAYRRRKQVIDKLLNILTGVKN